MACVGQFGSAVLILIGVYACAPGLHSCAHAAIVPQAGREARADELVAEGARALEQGDAERARELLERALRRDPADVAAITYLGVLADRLGDLASAESRFAAAVRLAPRDASARNNYGAILLRRGRAGEAATQFAESLRLDPRNASALVNSAQIRFARGTPADLHAARELFARAHEAEPAPETARALVVASLRLNDSAAAARHYRIYAPLAAAAPASARTELGQALLEGGLAAEAVEELTAALAVDGSDVPALVALARSHLKLNNVKAAGRVLEAAAAHGVDDARLYAALADVYERAGRPENAIPALRLAIERDPRSEAYRFRYGMLLTDSKAPAAAIIRLQESLEEFPKSSRLWLALGIAKLTHGNNTDAQKSFERALELDPKFAPAFAYLGTTYAERGQYAEAVDFYERAIAADVHLAVPYYLAAEALLKGQNIDAARIEKYLKRAVELDPAFASARMALAKLYARGERWPEAAEQFKAVVGLAPDLAEARYQLGRVYTRLKLTAEAQKELAVFKELSELQKQRKETDRRDLLRRLADVRF